MTSHPIDTVFKDLKKLNRKALICYLPAGYPSFAKLEKLIPAIEKAGANILELGIPFSDPIADGPTIQYASQKALENNANLPKILHWTARLSKQTKMPLVYMSYLNPIYQFGLVRFAKKAHDSGVSGVIIPDIIPEESAEIESILSKRGIKLIYLVAPTTPKSRQIKIASKSKGFLYAVSVRGVTGARAKLPKETRNWLNGLRRQSKVPTCAGFGISSPSQIQHLRPACDGFIVGSALIDTIRKAKEKNQVAAATKFVRQLSKECING